MFKCFVNVFVYGVEALKSLEDSPEKAGKRLKPSNFWSLRVGDYRAIYEIDKATAE